MDNQHQKITGYRDLSQDEIDLMNEIKSKGAEVGALIQRLEAMQKKECEFSGSNDDPDFVQRVESVLEARRWTAIAKTQLQQGLMALTRAVARPTTF